MTFSLTVGYLVIGATLLRAALVQARVLPPSCGRCGLAFERRYLGEGLYEYRLLVNTESEGRLKA